MDRVALESVLQSTTCHDMRDKELLQWLRAAEEWLPSYSQYIDICLHLVRILCTFPWGRFTSSKHSTGSTTMTSTRTISKMLASFERLCCALITRSQQLVIPTLEAAFKPFSTTGVRNAIPIDTITRIINHCVATYPNNPAMIKMLFIQALDPLCPPKRWGMSFHHECYMLMLLNLALEAHLPTDYTLVGSFKELSVLSSGGDLATSSVGLAKTPQVMPMLTPTGGLANVANAFAGSSSSASTLLSAVVGGGGGVGGAAAANSETDGGKSHTSGRGGGGGNAHHTVLSNEELSDAARGSGVPGANEGVQLSGHNKLMSYQVRLIGLVLSKLMEMEMSIEFEDADIETIVNERRRRKRSRKEASHYYNSVNHTPASTPMNAAPSGHRSNTTPNPQQSSSASSSTAMHAAADNATIPALSVAEQFSYEHQDPNGYESPLHMLRMCVARVHERLATEMTHRKKIGACDRPAWWSELQAFHVDCVSKIKNPIALHFLAPSIAVLGVAGEATELVHKVVSAVMKGGCEKRPSVAMAMLESMRAGPGAMGGGGGGMRMAPPPQQSEKLNPKQRVLAATHIYPLFAALYRHLQPDTCEGLMRRLFKFVGSEGGGGSAPKHQQQQQQQYHRAGAMMGGGGGGAGTLDAVVDTVLGQALCMSRLLKRAWDATDDLPEEVKARIVAEFAGILENSTDAGGAGGAAIKNGKRDREGRDSGVFKPSSYDDEDAGAGSVLSNAAAAFNAETMEKVCDACIQQSRVKPNLYTASCPWSSNRYMYALLRNGGGGGAQ